MIISPKNVVAAFPMQTDDLKYNFFLHKILFNSFQGAHLLKIINFADKQFFVQSQNCLYNVFLFSSRASNSENCKKVQFKMNAVNGCNVKAVKKTLSAKNRLPTAINWRKNYHKFKA